MKKLLIAALILAGQIAFGVTELNDKTSDEFWKLPKTQKVAVEVYADWCQYCKAMEPMYQKLEAKYPNVKFYKLNIDSNPEYRQLVSGLPTILVGTPQIPNPSQIRGLPKSQEELEKVFEKVLKESP